jgi:hypothetical protein
MTPTRTTCTSSSRGRHPSDEDAPRLHQAATRLNRNIKRVVAKRQGFRFVSLVPVFRDHPACDKGSVQWINGVVESEKNESFHPTWKGHFAIAAKLQQVGKRWFKR